MFTDDRSDMNESKKPKSPRKRLILQTILITTGTVLLPIAIAFIFNSWVSPTPAAAIRMSFATVIGQTISMSTAIIAAVLGFTWGKRNTTSYVVATLAVAIVIFSVGNINRAADVLLLRLFT
ncbi:hypothetical protein [Microbacterium sp. 22242]|uniref:hypothetical protein n=1 Tax=Microbacterium sp. 22242 TaxID=3453896 RepID=UPI003F8571DF